MYCLTLDQNKFYKKKKKKKKISKISNRKITI